MSTFPPLRLGLAGTGFIASGLLGVCASRPDLRVTGVLTRRPLEQVRWPRPELLTRSVEQLVEEADVIVECSGTVRHAAVVVAAAVAAVVVAVQVVAAASSSFPRWFRSSSS